MDTSDVAKETTEQYLSRMSHVTGCGYATLGIAIGNELGLFQAMAELDRPATAAEVAKRANCKERYVREWLLQMAMARVVIMGDGGATFHYPKERLDGMMKATSFAALLPRITVTHEELLEAFKLSGPPGVSGEKARGMLVYQDANKPFKYAEVGVRNVEELQPKLAAGVEVLEIGIGSGKVLLDVAQHYPKSRFYGVDIDPGDVHKAVKLATDRGAPNVVFQVQDGANLPDEWSSKFEAVSLFDTLHDIPHASKTAKEIARVLKPGGYCFIVETKGPSDPLAQLKENPDGSSATYTLSLYHCLSVSLSVEGSEGLGPGFGKERIVQMMEEAGLKFVSVVTVPPERLISKTQLTFVKPGSGRDVYLHSGYKAE